MKPKPMNCIDRMAIAHWYADYALDETHLIRSWLEELWEEIMSSNFHGGKYESQSIGVLYDFVIFLVTTFNPEVDTEFPDLHRFTKP